MYLFKFTGILGALTAVHAFSGDGTCNGPSTVFVTVSETATATVTETVVLTTHAPVSVAAEQFQSVDTSPSITVLTEITGTSTIFATHTNFVSVVEVTPTSVSANQGPFYFSVHDGTTEWAGGKTPPATYSQVLQTATVVVVPVPTSHSTSSMEKALTTTSTLTIMSTIYLTQALTKTVVETNSLPLTPLTSIVTIYLTETVVSNTIVTPSPLKSFTGIGSSGWNTSTTHQQSTAGATGTGLPGPHTYAIGASGVIAPSFKSTNSAPTAIKSGEKINKMKARQVGALVTATINGVIVSWTNTYDGSTPTKSLPLAPIASTSSIVVPASSTTALVTLSTVPDTSSTAPISSSTTMSALAIPFGPPSVRHSIYTNSSTSAVVILSTGVVPPIITSTPTTVCTDKLSTSTSATLISSVTPSPTSQCNRGQGPAGNIGNLTINFDDLPRFSAPPNDTDYPPLFSPYHNLFWANGFAYVPPPTDPYPPVSPPQLAVFVNNASANVHPEGNPANAAGEVSGEFGAGSNFADSAFWFDVYSAYFGCANKGPGLCMITMSGYSYEDSFGNQVQDAEQVVYQPPCPTLTDCSMMKVNMNGEFRKLTNIQINATVDGVPVTWYMDDLSIGWSNNSCAAVEARMSLTLGFPFVPDKVRRS